MTVIARGTKQVADFQRAVSGPPPRVNLQKSRAALAQGFADHLETKRRARGDAKQLAQPLHELAFAHIPKDDPTLRRSIEANRKSFARRTKHAVKVPRSHKLEAQVKVGSIQVVRVPPYDNDWSGPATASRVEADADKTSGTYHLQTGSAGDGNWTDVAAGVAIYFQAAVDDQQQRVAALIDYSDFWFDDAWGYVAENDLSTHLWIWSSATNDWWWKADVAPNWSDGVGWFESHGNGDGEDASVEVETRFPAYAGTWYGVWIWSDAAVYADGGFWGDADSFIHFNASVPLIVVGSLD